VSRNGANLRRRLVSQSLKQSVGGLLEWTESPFDLVIACNFAGMLSVDLSKTGQVELQQKAISTRISRLS
jgi:hypothetical protein